MNILNKGDKIALVSPSGFIDKSSLQNGVNWLKAQGFVPELMPHTLACYRYMGGTDKERADDINQAFA